MRTVTPVIPSGTQPASFAHNPPVVMVSGLARKRIGWGGNGAFGFPAFVMRALQRAHERWKEQLSVKRRQAGTSCKDEDDSKDVRLKCKTLTNSWKRMENSVNKAIIHTVCGHESQFGGDKIQCNIAKHNAPKLISKLLCITAWLKHKRKNGKNVKQLFWG